MAVVTLTSTGDTYLPATQPVSYVRTCEAPRRRASTSGWSATGTIGMQQGQGTAPRQYRHRYDSPAGRSMSRDQFSG